MIETINSYKDVDETKKNFFEVFKNNEVLK